MQKAQHLGRRHRRFERLDHAVNCAGIDPEIHPDPEWDFDVYQKVMSVNVNSVFLCMRREIQHMRQVAAGTIVNLSSNSGLQGVPTKPIYCASKHAVLGFTRAAGLQYGRMGVRINAICPGATRTQMIMPNIEKIPGGEAVMNTALRLVRRCMDGETAECAVAEQPALRASLQLLEHAQHADEGREPLVDLP